MATIQKSTLKFLNDLSKNNNREWFKDHSKDYEEVKTNAKEFLAGLENEMNKHDVIEKTKLFRIYRDVRFSKDKTPYNTHISMSMSREGAFRRGGYYLRITPGDTMLAGGFWNPEPSDLKLIRSHISSDKKRLEKVLNSKAFKSNFGQLYGEKLSSAPRGFDKNDPALEHIQYKQFIIKKVFTDKEVCQDNFMKELVKGYNAMIPFFDYMTDILTHDLNGIPLYES